ncbi:hypothetical protein PC116_g31501 [Phytophthora cactorum]|nr:hypothetical protein PC116_g31501 [Phytophthora cactorum]
MVASISLAAQRKKLAKQLTIYGPVRPPPKAASSFFIWSSMT